MAADAEREQLEQAKVRATENLRRIKREADDSDSSKENEADEGPSKPRGTRKEDLVLNQYENLIAMEVVAPEDIPVGFDGKTT